MLLVVVAVIQHAERILMVQEAKARALGTWNLPGGRVEPGEGLAAAMLREIQEEAGVAVALRGLLFADQVLAGGAGGGPRMRFVFMAEPLTFTLKSHPDEHSLRAQWFSRSELPSLPLRNPHVVEMVDFATQNPQLLPMSSLRARAGDAL
ncbi:MAG: NUDIX domain-containing protein [Polyangiales bacterium]